MWTRLAQPPAPPAAPSPQPHVGVKDSVVELLLVGVDELAHLLLVQDLVQHLGLAQPQLRGGGWGGVGVPAYKKMGLLPEPA